MPDRLYCRTNGFNLCNLPYLHSGFHEILVYSDTGKNSFESREYSLHRSGKDWWNMVSAVKKKVLIFMKGPQFARVVGGGGGDKHCFGVTLNLYST